MSLVITASYDASVTSLATSDPTLYANYVGATQTAINYFESLISNPITLTMNFGYGEVGGTSLVSGALGENSSNYFIVSYAQLQSRLVAADTTSAIQTAAAALLPGTDPTGGTGEWLVSQALAVSLGIAAAPMSAVGSIGLSSTSSFSFDQSSVAPGTFDAVGVLEHEISEVLGRVAFGGQLDTGTNKPLYSALDLFRYTAADGGNGDPIGAAAGVRDQPFVTGYSASAFSYFSYNGTTVGLQFDTPTQVASGSDVGDWAPSVHGDAFGFGSTGTVQQISATDLQVMNVLGYDLNCYLADTQIATPSGEVAVQDLAVGDAVLTLGGAVQSIVWIGTGKALVPRGARNAATPVVVRKDAIGDNVPSRDLYLTKGHSLFIDDVLIPVEYLVNHRSIVWDDHGGEVTVYHLELAEHAVLLANNTPAESYRDDENRWLFHNANAGWSLPPKPACAPVLTGGAIVDAIWYRLLTRAGTKSQVAITDAADLHLIADGVRIDAAERQRDGRHVFHLPAAPSQIRIVSRAGAQDMLGLARDPRMLGVALQRIVVWNPALLRLLEVNDPLLVEGFYKFEADNGIRWTNGDAALPTTLFADFDGAISLELHVAATTHYPLTRKERLAA